MERRVLFAIVLSFLVLYAYNTFLAPPPPKPAASAAAPKSPGGTAPPPAAAAKPSAAAPSVPSAPAPQALTSEAGERQIVVDTATIEAVLTNRGARVLHWRLKDYRDDAGKPVDLVPSAVPADQPTPFSLRVDDSQVTDRINSAVYRVTGDAGGRVDATSAAVTVAFDY